MDQMHDEKTIFPEINPKKSVEIISKFIKNVIEESGSDGLVVGLSGGIDSSLVTYIAAQAVEKDNILGLIMPSETTSSKDVEDAMRVAEELGIKKEIIPIDKHLEQFQDIDVYPKSEDHLNLAKANLKARIRMMILYYHANSMNRLVLGTGNKSELLVGYFTKYGDGGVDLLPLGDLYKVDVQKIAKHLNVPENIIKKAPTAGLWYGQTDEEELGMKYQLLDKILYLMVEENLRPEQVADKLQISKEEVFRIKSMMRSAEHKLVTPPIAEIKRQ